MNNETRIGLALIASATIVMLAMVSCQWHADNLSSGCDTEMRNGGGAAVAKCRRE